ncbi:TIGR03013 family PEP-CTERM/XrtA system glycosyltransferase [Massilia sp. MB5]|uniref:TIGR03013 family XrtA/PEP-CTERM system glycosyltransferase n=1 Tax=Massilia sp. MB5 TaxID=2919578 RepID=UPI001F1132E3|nr:TIGR03013 family XrtA/PEP-CTERM system glycosyltransferase [Massilia sp. MB5]UMR29317.1 TIGR03013 family PEP-CTERM/XrtA system glycosyltransferase [Massilia sp. MB5]
MVRIFNHYVSRAGIILLLLEVLALLAAAVLVSLVWLPERRPGQMYLAAVVFVAPVVACMAALGMYGQQRCEDAKALLARLLPALVLAYLLHRWLILLAPAAALRSGMNGAAGDAAWLAFLLGAGGVLLTRMLLFGSRQSRLITARVILVGDGMLALECLQLAAAPQGLHQFHVIGCVPVPGENSCVPAGSVLPSGQPLLALARAYEADEVIVSVADRRNGAYPVRELLECALGGVHVTDAAQFFEREASQIRVDSLQPSYLIFGGGFDQGPLRAAVKRCFDLLASAAICIAALPLMALAAAAIVVEDGGPVIFRQERVGRHGQPFQLLKFRSMRIDAESDGRPRWAELGDARITRVGRWIRLLRIDELPQMLNVFRGEMSFVGPRPERAFFVDQLVRQVPYYDVRHSIKPGITGLAQVRYQYGASLDDAVRKLQYDLYYVKNNSLFLDLLILIDTVQVVLFGKGSR